MKWSEHVKSFGHAGAPLDITARVARLLLGTFLMTFLLARIAVFLIAEQCVPNMFLFVKGVHVHHLNYGICILSAVGLFLLLCRPRAAGLYLATLAYGIGLALTFDEFGFWFNPPRAAMPRSARWEYTGVVVILSFFLVTALFRRLRSRRPPS